MDYFHANRYLKTTDYYLLLSMAIKFEKCYGRYKFCGLKVAKVCVFLSWEKKFRILDLTRVSTVKNECHLASS